MRLHYRFDGAADAPVLALPSSLGTNGTFELSGVLLGQYELSAIRIETKGGMPTDRVWTATVPLVVGAAAA